MTDIFTVEIPALINGPRGPAIYQPSTAQGAPNPITRYGITVPYDDRFADCRIKTHDQRTGEEVGPFVYATSDKPPVIMIAGEYEERRAWRHMLAKAGDYRIPHDLLLSDRPLTAAVSLWSNGRGSVSITLHAIQIHGDLTKSDALNARITEIKGWFS